MDSSLTSGVKQAGDVEFIKLELIDPKSNYTRYNLLGSFVDLTIYEDLFSPVLSGYVAIIETQNLIDTLPIIGEELLYAEFKTPTLDTMKCTFVVTKVGVREHNDKKNAYTLEFISYEGYVDLNRKFSKAYSGNTSDLMKTTYRDTFKKDMSYLEESDNFIKFVSPYWSPLKILNHITSRSIYPNSKMVTPNYMFYQTTSGHKFKSLTSMLGAKASSQFIFDKNPARVSLTDGTSVRDIDREYKTAKELSFVESQDYVKNMLNGAYNHRVFGMNIFKKQFNLNTYSIGKEFDNTVHANEYMPTRGSAANSSGLHTIHHTYPNLFDRVPDVSADIVAKRLSLLAHLELNKIKMVVHGRTDIEVGKVVDVLITKFKTVDITDKHTTDTYDKSLSGRYLITAIQHRFTQAKHEINMELIKDSISNKLIIEA